MRAVPDKLKSVLDKNRPLQIKGFRHQNTRGFNWDIAVGLTGSSRPVPEPTPVLPMGRRDELAEILSDEDFNTLRHLVNEGMGANSLRALTSDLDYLQAWSLAAPTNPALGQPQRHCY